MSDSVVSATSPARLRSSGRDAATPDGMSVERWTPDPVDAGDPYREALTQREDMRLRWRWHNNYRGLTAFAFVFLNLCIAASVLVGHWLPSVYFVVFVAVGAWTLYYGFAHRRNVTQIELIGDELVATELPLPLRRPLRLRAAAVDQLWVEQTVAHDTPVGFSVMVQTREGRTVRLVPDMDTREQALWVAEQLGDCLGLGDDEQGEVDS